MKIIVETPNISASDKLIELINKKLEKVEQVSDQVVEARVYLKTEKSDINKNNSTLLTQRCSLSDSRVKRVGQHDIQRH